MKLPWRKRGDEAPETPPVTPFPYDLFEHVKNGASANPETWTRHQDWNQVLFAETRQGTLAVCPLPPADAFEEGSPNREVFVKAILPLFVTTTGATRLVMLLNCTWTVGIEDAFRESPYPEGINGLYIREFTAEGLGRSEVAVVTRDERGVPSLAEWEEWIEEGELQNEVVAALRGELTTSLPPEVVAQVGDRIAAAFPAFKRAA